MSQKIADEFHLIDWNEIEAQAELSSAEKYKRISAWAARARGRNPKAFDALCDWLADDGEWAADKLAENEQILMQGVFARFREQNARLRAYLRGLEPSGVVNPAVFAKLDAFDRTLRGDAPGEIHHLVARMFADFSCMAQRDVRTGIGGDKTGAHGTNVVENYGFFGHLKTLDASVQWTLFMPDFSKQQQQGFEVDSFEYKNMPAMRFIGREADKSTESAEGRKELFAVLDAMAEHASDWVYDIVLMHHYGRGVNVEPWHGFWGRFMKADAPVPEGFVSCDFVPQHTDEPGPPFVSQFAFARFSGDAEAVHRREGFDSDAMYDVTRNIILGHGAHIPYPDKYWTAEVFLDGHAKPGTAYMFSAVCDDRPLG